MGFLRNGPKGHSPRFKAFHDGFYRFYFFYGYTAPFRQVEYPWNIPYIAYSHY